MATQQTQEFVNSLKDSDGHWIMSAIHNGVPYEMVVTRLRKDGNYETDREAYIKNLEQGLWGIANEWYPERL